VPGLGLRDRVAADAFAGAGAAGEEDGQAESARPAHRGDENPRPPGVEQDEECSYCSCQDEGGYCDKPETGAVPL
jgi:hypothetical protein